MFHGICFLFFSFHDPLDNVYVMTLLDNFDTQCHGLPKLLCPRIIFEKTKKLGNVISSYHLGEMHLNEYGVPKITRRLLRCF